MRREQCGRACSFCGCWQGRALLLCSACCIGQRGGQDGGHALGPARCPSAAPPAAHRSAALPHAALADIPLPADAQLLPEAEEEQKAKEPEKWLELGLVAVG